METRTEMVELWIFRLVLELWLKVRKDADLGVLWRRREGGNDDERIGNVVCKFEAVWMKTASSGNIWR